jgi:hypothetical protein
MTLDRQLIAEIAREVVARIEALEAGAGAQTPSSVAGALAGFRPQANGGVGPQTRGAAPHCLGDGVFATVDEAVQAAARAQAKVAAMSLDERGRIIAIIRRMCAENAPEWARAELKETGLGRLDHKIEKLKIIKNVLGVEFLRSQVRTDASGLCLIERAPWGVIGMVLPATHSYRCEQRHQCDCGGKYGDIQPASGRGEDCRRGAARVQPGDRAGDGRFRCHHNRGRAEPAIRGGDFPSSGNRAAVRHRGAGRGQGGGEVREARDRGGAGQSAGGGG